MYQAIKITIVSKFEWEGSGGGDFIPQVPFITIIYMEYSIMNNIRKLKLYDLYSLLLQVAASALGTVIGNVGTNLAGNFLNGCNNRGKRSIYVSSNDMHKMRKRQAVNLEADEKSEDPEVKSVSNISWSIYHLNNIQIFILFKGCLNNNL